VALVSGAGGGIASAAVEQLAAEGCDVVCVDVDEDAARRVAEVVEGKGRAALPLQADLTRASAVESVVAAAIERFGRIDVLVNAVGIGGVSPVDGHPEDLWDRVIDVNLKSIFLLCRAVLPHMKERETGRIVMLTSRAVHRCNAGSAAYTAAKGGLAAFSRVLTIEAGEHGITVNCVAPGITLTPMTEDYYGGPDERGEAARESGVILEPARLAEPAEIAQAIVYLCGPGSDYVTGTTIHVNGGSFMS
jgi:3-oxoacyl-[acyl-carrier protein] reductase